MTVSQHPTDRLIRELVDDERSATGAEIAAIVVRIASAPFDPRSVAVPPALRGLTYNAQTLGNHAPSLDLHMVKRLIVERQWSDSTTTTQYLSDLRRAVRAPETRISTYVRRGGYIVGALSPTVAVIPPSRRGAGALPLLLVIYSVDRGMIISGYQVSTIEQTGIPQEARWPNKR